MRWIPFFIVAAGLWGQTTIQRLTFVAVDPTGACSVSQAMQYNTTNGNLWGCVNSVWTVAGSTSGGGGGGTVPGYPPNQILAGCGVEYVTGLTFTIGACTYTINGPTYASPLSAKTLAAADPTNDRIDVIGVDNTNAVFVLTGTPAASPQQPTIDPATQLQLTFVYVAANATTPSNITVTTLYDENTEWTCAASTNLNCASTNNPYHLTKDIEATTAVLTNNVTLTKPASGTVDLANFNTLTFYIRSKGTWPTGNGGGNAARNLTITWLNGSTVKGQAVVLRTGVFGFDSSITTVYQQVSIPLSLFGVNGIPVTTLKFAVSGNTGTSSIGFYIDEVTLQNGTVTSIPTSITKEFEYLAGVCQESAASSGFSWLTATKPTPACLTGSNVQTAALQFTAASQCVQFRTKLPDTWIAGSGNNVEVRFYSESAGATGTVKWDYSNKCLANTAATLNPAFNTAQVFTGVTATTNNTTNIDTLANFTAGGCSPGTIMLNKVCLNSGTTATGNESLLSIVMKLRATN